MANALAMVLSLPIYFGIPAIILYFVIKIAIKKAINELKDENIM